MDAVTFQVQVQIENKNKLKKYCKMCYDFILCIYTSNMDSDAKLSNSFAFIIWKTNKSS